MWRLSVSYHGRFARIGVKPLDPVTFAAASLGLVAAAVTASYFPQTVHNSGSDPILFT